MEGKLVLNKKKLSNKLKSICVIKTSITNQCLFFQRKNKVNNLTFYQKHVFINPTCFAVTVHPPMVVINHAPPDVERRSKVVCVGYVKNDSS